MAFQQTTRCNTLSKVSKVSFPFLADKGENQMDRR